MWAQRCAHVCWSTYKHCCSSFLKTAAATATKKEKRKKSYTTRKAFDRFEQSSIACNSSCNDFQRFWYIEANILVQKNVYHRHYTNVQTDIICKEAQVFSLIFYRKFIAFRIHRYYILYSIAAAKYFLKTILHTCPWFLLLSIHSRTHILFRLALVKPAYIIGTYLFTLR